MTPAEAKQLVGKQVRWRYATDAARGTYLEGRGTLEHVQGKNVMIDGDYKWLPDLKELRAAGDE